MRFRGRRFGARGRAPKEPVIWVRNPYTTLNAGAQTLSNGKIANLTVTSAAPAAVVGLFGGTAIFKGLDQRLTLRRLILQLNWGAATIVDGDLEAIMGVYLSGQAEPIRNPLLPTDFDAQTDWLDLWRVAVSTSGTAPIASEHMGYPMVRNIKAQRKVNEDQVIAWVVQLSRGGGGALSGAQTLTFTTMVSALFQRTMRTR